MPVVGIGIAIICFFAVLYWWSEGAIEASDAVVLAALFCGISIGLFAARTPAQFLIAFIPLLATAGYALYTWRQGGIRAYYKRRMSEYFEAIQADPRNLAARQFFAETLYSLGELDRAVDEMQAALDMGAGHECAYTLAKWQREQRTRDAAALMCRWCGTEHSLGDRTCSRCGADLPYESPVSRWLMGGRSARARYWLMLIAAVTVAAISMVFIPPLYALLPLAGLGAVLVGWWLISSARH